MLRKGSDFSDELIEKSWRKDSANESGLKFIPCFDSSFAEFIQLGIRECVSKCQNGDYGIESQSDNTVGNPHWFVIHGIVISKNIKKVTKEINVENLARRQLSVVEVDCFFVRMEVFCFIDEVFDSEYVQVQVMVQHVQSWKHVFISNLQNIGVMKGGG
ncbi:hypothetical protein Tco_1234831 [Tanacetum coccineum]